MNKILTGCMIGMLGEYLCRVEVNPYVVILLIMWIVMGIIQLYKERKNKDKYIADEDLEKGDLVYINGNRLCKYRFTKSE